MAKTKAPKYNRICKQGKTYKDGFAFKDKYDNPISYSDYVGARIEIRSQIPDTDSEPGDDDVLITLSTETGEITIDGNKVLIEIGSDVTATFPVGTYFWELELIGPGDPPYIPYMMEPSTFKVTSEVTLNE